MKTEITSSPHKKFWEGIEAALTPLTDRLVPRGLSAKAVMHQWAHAIASDGELVGGAHEADVVKALETAGIYKTKPQFKKKLRQAIAFPPPSNPRFAFIDLFAGIGGFRQALQALGGYCAFSSEWDQSAQRTYFANYGEMPFGDITEITRDGSSAAEICRWIPSHDILAAGFPCQPFSNAGVSARNAVGREHGFACQTQGTLFFDITQIVAARRPKVLFLENVKNIEKHDGGRTFRIIRDSIEDLNYSFNHKIIDASTLVPQRRQRCYMVCFRNDLKVNFEFPILNGPSLPLSSILEKGVDKTFTISDRLWLGHQNRSARNVNRGTGFTAYTADLTKPSNTLVARYGKDGKECLIPQRGKNPRMLTPRECARLQGYPEAFILPASRTPAYKQFGNSVAVPVVSLIARQIAEALK